MLVEVEVYADDIDIMNIANNGRDVFDLVFVNMEYRSTYDPKGGTQTMGRNVAIFKAVPKGGDT